MELWCRGNAELNIRAMSQDQSRKIGCQTTLLFNGGATGKERNKTNLFISSKFLYAMRQICILEYVATCHKVPCHCYMGIIPWSCAHTHQSARLTGIKQRQRRMLGIWRNQAVDPLSESCPWARSRWNTSVSPTLSAREEVVETKKKPQLLLHTAAYLWPEHPAHTHLVEAPSLPTRVRSLPCHGPQKAPRNSSVCEMLWMTQTHP